MRERVRAQLASIEREHDCRVLYACESGSRAWGFASPDSDYDVRFVYTHPVAWHLRLEERRDSIEFMAPDALDLSGWELGKALRLFAGCSPALNEWLGSPEVYRAEEEFVAAMRALVPAYFNPRKALHHYLSMAQKTADREIRDGQVRIKKAFYVLRPLLACRWILDRLEMPPTPFRDLLEQPLPEELRAAIGELLDRKSRAAEGELATLSAVLATWIGEALEHTAARAAGVPASRGHDWEPLNALMLRWVGHESGIALASHPGADSGEAGTGVAVLFGTRPTP